MFQKTHLQIFGLLSGNEHHLIKEALLLEVPEHLQGSPNLNPSWTDAYLTTCHCLTYSSKNNLELALAPNTQALVFQPSPTIAARHFNPKLSAKLSVACEIECQLLPAICFTEGKNHKRTKANLPRVLKGGTSDLPLHSFPEATVTNWFLLSQLQTENGRLKMLARLNFPQRLSVTIFLYPFCFLMVATF